MLPCAIFFLSLIPPVSRFSSTRLLKNSPMSAQSLPEWFQSRINSIFIAPDESARTVELDNFFAPDTSVRRNDEQLDIQEKRRRIQSLLAASTASEVKWDRIEETSPGNLEGQYVITVSSKFRIRAAPMQRHITVKFSAKVDEDATAEGDHKRRIVSLQEQEEIQQAPVHIAQIPRKTDDEQEK